MVYTDIEKLGNHIWWDITWNDLKSSSTNKVDIENLVSILEEVSRVQAILEQFVNGRPLRIPDYLTISEAV